MKAPLAIGCALWLCQTAFADTATFNPVADTTISEGNGARPGAGDMIVGHLSSVNAASRGLLRFDLGSLPAGAVVTSVTLNFTVLASKSGGPDTHAVHKLTALWDEVSATWLNSGLAAWEEAGGDYVGTADASVSVGGSGPFAFSSTSALANTVQSWIANPSANFGWVLRSESEASGASGRRIATREGSPVPELVVEYTAPPPIDFNVTSPGAFFSINGQSPNPTLTLTRGSNYIFGVSTDSSHPFQIVSNTNGTPYSNGLSTNNIYTGTIAFSVPQNAPDTLYYISPGHFLGGTIQIVDPPPPPPPPDFAVTTPDSYYIINGGDPNPTLTLTRGVTYTFGIDADPSHPFEIVDDGGFPWDEGVINNNISSGLLTFTVPANAPDTLYYICSIHTFGGQIDIVDPPPPPLLVRIVSLNLSSSNVVMRSLGTNGNGWVPIPEFSSNLVVSQWAPVPGYSNSFQNGTNVTTFNRLDPICGPNVFLRMKNVRN